MMKPKKNPVTKLVVAGAKAVAKARSPKLSKLAENYDNALKVRAGKAPESKIEKRAINAARGKSLASPIKKAVAKKNAKERLVAKNMASANIKVFKANPKEAYAKSAKVAEDMKARDIKFAKKLPNTYDLKTMKNVKLKNKKSK